MSLLNNIKTDFFLISYFKTLKLEIYLIFFSIPRNIAYNLIIFKSDNKIIFLNIGIEREQWEVLNTNKLFLFW